MEKQILNILYKYKNKPADQNFVKDILTILRKQYHCEEYLKRIVVYRFGSDIKERKFSGCYSPKHKSIYIDVSTYDHFNIDQYEKNIGILVMILHEFTHVTQEIENKDNVLQNKLLRLSNHISFESKLGDIHDCLPDERMANIRSVIWCINILSEDFLNNYKIIKKQKAILYNYMLHGYSFSASNTLTSPLETSLREANVYDENKQILNTKEYPLSQRIVYGLPITIEEYDGLVENHNKYCNKTKEENKLKIKII